MLEKSTKQMVTKQQKYNFIIIEGVGIEVSLFVFVSLPLCVCVCNRTCA